MKTLEKTGCVVVKCSKLHQEEKKNAIRTGIKFDTFFLFLKKGKKLCS